ncbi:MAG TPA: ion channel [Byssovorax sp.]|jgi:inward rectifier potassium channel
MAHTSAREQANVEVVGARKKLFGDVYHATLRLRWSATLGGIVAVYLALNALFACGYVVTGGVTGVRRRSFEDAFFFSVQTMGTIGYGAMYPHTGAAHAMVVAESVVGMLTTALVTGLVFAKFSRSTGRIVFSREAVITLMDGVPTLMFRVGNERANLIVEALMRVSLVRTEVTAEGMTFYRLYDLVLARDRSQAMSRSWSVMHPITGVSPLLGATPESLIKDEIELFVSVVGTDETTVQPVHARHTYYHDEIVWGARHADVLTDEGDKLVLDLRRFHDLEPTVATDAFPYPRPTAS